MMVRWLLTETAFGPSWETIIKNNGGFGYAEIQ